MNTCRSCEVNALKDTLKTFKETMSQEFKSIISDDIILLTTRKPVNETHRKNIRKVYGLKA